MKKDLVFDIDQLFCKYKNKNFAALRINSLKIYRGEITFFIGTSGSGKSTILESMGLMNNTLDPFINKGYLKFIEGDVQVNFFDLWKKSENEVSKFRRKYFNFIFQSENLFSSLSGLQNVMIPSILAGSSSKIAFEKAVGIMNDILPEFKLDKNNTINIKEISGGQRQRLSFGRAIISDFSVLFADEPTGNLDFRSAENVMDILSNKIKEKNSTAIIVSHDIDLALKYADKIVFIDREEIMIDNKKISRGFIEDKCIFLREEKSWNQLNSSNKLTHKLFKKFLEDKFKY